MNFHRPSFVLTASAGLVVGAAPTVHAQDTAGGDSSGSVVTDESAFPVPFGPGEDLRYGVRLGRVPVGDAVLRIPRIDTVRGFPSYHIEMELDLSTIAGLLKLRNSYDSWLDTRTLVSRRFVRDIDEPGYEGTRHFEIYAEEKRWERTDEDKSGTAPLLAIDEIAFLHYVRTLPLEVGEELTLHRYFKEESNPVTLRVLRRERIEVPAGVFDAVVVQPVFKTSGIFSEGGEAEVYYTDDEDRHIVYLRSKIPVVGAMSLHLESVTKGTPLNPQARSGS